MNDYIKEGDLIKLNVAAWDQYGIVVQIENEDKIAIIIWSHGHRSLVDIAQITKVAGS